MNIELTKANMDYLMNYVRRNGITPNLAINEIFDQLRMNEGQTNEGDLNGKLYYSNR